MKGARFMGKQPRERYNIEMKQTYGGIHSPKKMADARSLGMLADSD